MIEIVGRISFSENTTKCVCFCISLKCRFSIVAMEGYSEGYLVGLQVGN
jgi:hypothetical protein